MNPDLLLALLCFTAWASLSYHIAAYDTRRLFLTAIQWIVWCTLGATAVVRAILAVETVGLDWLVDYLLPFRDAGLVMITFIVILALREEPRRRVRLRGLDGRFGYGTGTAAARRKAPARL